jgi:hypothetical protein
MPAGDLNAMTHGRDVGRRPRSRLGPVILAASLLGFATSGGMGGAVGDAVLLRRVSREEETGQSWWAARLGSGGGERSRGRRKWGGSKELGAFSEGVRCVTFVSFIFFFCVRASVLFL